MCLKIWKGETVISSLNFIKVHNCDWINTINELKCKIFAWYFRKENIRRNPSCILLNRITNKFGFDERH